MTNFSRMGFEKSSNIGFYENPYSGSPVVPCGHTDGWTDRQMNTKKITVAFGNLSTAPKNYTQQFLLISNLMHKILIYLHIIHLLKSSTCFEHYPAHLQEGYVITVYTQPLVSSLSAGDCPLHQLRKSSFLTGAQDSHLQRVTIPEAAYIQL